MVFYPGQFCATVHCKGVKLQRKTLQSSLWDYTKQGASYSEVRLHQSKLTAPRLFP